MANKKQYTVEIKLNEDAELSSAILFFQKLIILLAKFGVTYFKEAILYADFKELARYETNYSMGMAIQEFHRDKLAQQAHNDTEEVQ